MREIILSFQPRIFNLIRSGKKIYEYRYQFPNEPIRAYMYVSKPVQAIVGYVDLDCRIDLNEWKKEYNDPDTVQRIEEYLSKNYRFVMPINRFVMTEPITLEELNVKLEKFIIPQSYYFLETFPNLKNLLKRNIIETGEKHENSFSAITNKDICIRNYD